MTPGVAQFAEKPAGCLTNSFPIANQLNKCCCGVRGHVVLEGRRAHQAQIHPDEVCRALRHGLREQKGTDAVASFIWTRSTA